MEKCLVIFSGGQDSTTVAAWAKKKFDSVYLLGFFYNQKHKIELEQAKIIASKFNLPFQIITLDFFDSICDSALFANSNHPLNDAHYTHQNLPASFVPNRNAMFITIAHSLAQKIQANHIAIGVSEQDYSGYPDCRLDFIASIESTLNLSSETQIKIHTPLIHIDKAQEFKMAQELGVLDVILKDTHTCYEGIRDVLYPWGYGCGKCNACILRKNAYEKFLSQDY